MNSRRSVSAMLGSLLLTTGVVGGVTARPVQAAAAPAQREETYQTHNKRDPFVALVQGGHLVTAAESDIPDTALPSLGGILWDPRGHSIALLNGTEAKVGDKVDGYRVKEIRQDDVTLTLDDGRSVVMQMGVGLEVSPSKPSSQGRR